MYIFPHNSQEIILHCSASPDHRLVPASEVHRWHRDRGWDGIGYHFVIHRNGSVELGRPVYWQGAHVRGRNHLTLGICLIGETFPSPKQLASLQMLVSSLRNQADHDEPIPIRLHREFDPAKTCPNFSLKELLTHPLWTTSVTGKP